MKDIEIKISQETRMVDLKKTVIGNDAENLQGNLIFSFTDNFVNGTARLEYEIGSNKKYIMLEKKEETYITPIKSVLTKKGQINMQLVITEGTSENDIPIFKSNIFYVFCNQSINAEIEQPDEYPSWIEIANSKINEIDEAILGVEEAKRYAIEKGNYAKEQGDYAKSQGDYAKEQKIEVVKANEEANRIINNFETNVGEYTTTFNENANNKTNDFDSNAESKTSDFNQNVDNKISEYNNNASDKLSAYNTNAENKKSEFNTNVANQTKTFNDNASSKLESYNQNDTTKTNAFNSNANSKTETYNNNHTEKLNAYNTNATSKVNEYNTNASTKLQEYNTNADNKIAEYDLHSQELDNKIISTRNELERVKNDVLETGTDTDTFVHLEDSAMAEYQELSVDGICEQETTSGKNLFKPLNATSNGITTTYDKNGVGTIKGTPTTSWVNISGSFIYPYPAGNYVLSIDKPKTFSVSIRGTYTDKELFEFSILAGSKTKNVKFRKEVYSMYAFINGIEAGATFNKTIKIQLEKGSTATDYEPYTGGQPSPSPDYPQEIKTIENSLKITSCNKNLWSLNNSYKTTASDYVLRDTAIPTLKAGTYTISLDNSTNANVMFTFKNSSGQEKMITLTTRSSITFTDDIVKVAIYIYANGTETTISNIQLEKGTQTTSFEQHLETQITANLPEGEFIGKINDTYKDTLNVVYKNDGQYHLVLNKMIGKIVLDGSEVWIKGLNVKGLTYFYCYINDRLIGATNTFVSNFTVGSSWTLKSYINIASFSGGNTAFNVMLEDTSITTVKDFKQWLSTHNTEVYYALATPYVVDLGVVDMPITYNEITNLFTDSDLMPNINAKYYRNFIITIQNLQVNEKALKQELVDINNRLSALETAQTSTTSESEVVE